MIDAVSGPSLVWNIVILVLLLASLATRRLSAGKILRTAAAWVAIFALLWLIVTVLMHWGILR